MPFDNARPRDYGSDGGPDGAALDRALVRFSEPHPYLLFRAPALPALRRRLAADPKLRRRFAELSAPRPDSCEEGSALAVADGTPRGILKRRARRLIAAAFAALVGEPGLAEPALAAARGALAGFAAAASWRDRAAIRSFLDCAEAAVAVAFAYDWLYEVLSGDERRAVEEALRRNLLEPALVAYADPGLLWPQRRDNCALVSHAGILVGALAALPRQQSAAADLVRRSLAGLSTALAGLAPDGAWREGLSYWSLAMRYAGLAIAALESAFGGSFGLAVLPGLGDTGDFALHAVGTAGVAFDFADSEPCFDRTPLAWLAHRFGRPIDGWLLGDGESCALPYAAIWPARRRRSPKRLGLPTGKIFHSGDLACFRNTWSPSPAARPVYLAIKGGNVGPAIAGRLPQQHEIILHAQADAGTFVVGGARHRWIVDLGPDDYDLPGYFDRGGDCRRGRRWRYYRARAAGHNTLLIGGRDQLPNTPAAIVGSCVEGAGKWAVLDLSAAYGEPAGAVRRGAALLGRQVIIQDEIAPAVGGDIVWTAHLAAEPVTLSGACARFRIGADEFAARILEPKGAVFELSLPPPPRSFLPADTDRRHGRPPGDGGLVRELPRGTAAAPIRRLRFAVPAGTRRLTVQLLPDCDGDEPELPVAPLDHWLARRPLRLTGVPLSRARSAELAAVSR